MLSLIVYGNDRLSLIFCIKYGEWAGILLKQKSTIDKKYYK